MGDETTLLIAEENLLQRFHTDDIAANNRRIHAICRAVENEENDAVDITFEIHENGTVRCSFRGTLERINRARSLLEYKLTGGRQHDMDPIEGLVPLNVANLQQLDRELSELRQFGCHGCNRSWWKKVFTYKPVSHCPKCSVCYNCVPRGQERGWGRYVCQHCGNTFSGFAVAGTPAPCFRCGNEVLPERIGPRPQFNDHGHHRYTHACAACDNGRIRPCPARSVLVFSDPHECAGSTASTFMTQASDAGIYND
ncbi:shiftless antiviral inhibitor of ribosomal frameshifting protein-like [Apostichopus japonicus]|uniref:shiftless antiviral inhibitor of ribosomal frameshifting protein-like n=1 Tax=Stichopus japonicus TaxID=307972 RepID=UPI003AB1D46C